MLIYGLVMLVLVVYCVVDLSRTPGAEVRTLPKVVWYLGLLFVPPLATVAWLLFGRPKRAGAGSVAPAARPVAPDDDEDFLRELRRRSRDPRDDAA